MGLLDSLKNVLGNRGKEEPAPDTPESAAAEETTYTVRSGDTLWRIAEAHYGDGEQYQRVFEANRDVLDAPERIVPGQVLKLPPLEG